MEQIGNVLIACLAVVALGLAGLFFYLNTPCKCGHPRRRHIWGKAFSDEWCQGGWTTFRDGSGQSIPCDCKGFRRA